MNLFGMIRYKAIAFLACASCLWAVSMLIGCASSATPVPESVGGEVGIASYYANRFHGRRTASGERYDRNAYTAAHRRLPFGTHVRVINLENGHSVDVRINDRGPFVKGRVIDVSYVAAQKLGMLRKGLINVRVERLD